MSNNKPANKKKDPVKKIEPVVPPISLNELGEILVRHYGITEGKYEVLVEFMIGMGSVGPSPDKRLPGATFGLSKIGLARSEKDGPFTVDAADLQSKEK